MQIIQQNNKKYKVLGKKTQSIFHYTSTFSITQIGAVNLRQYRWML
jgi:hypothetical protein